MPLSPPLGYDVRLGDAHGETQSGSAEADFIFCPVSRARFARAHVVMAVAAHDFTGLGALRSGLRSVAIAHRDTAGVDSP